MNTTLTSSHPLTELNGHASGKQTVAQAELVKRYQELVQHLRPEVKRLLDEWETKKANYQGENFTYSVRGKRLR